MTFSSFPCIPPCKGLMLSSETSVRSSQRGLQWLILCVSLSGLRTPRLLVKLCLGVCLGAGCLRKRWAFECAHRVRQTRPQGGGRHLVPGVWRGLRQRKSHALSAWAQPAFLSGLSLKWVDNSLKGLRHRGLHSSKSHKFGCFRATLSFAFFSKILVLCGI